MVAKCVCVKQAVGFKQFFFKSLLPLAYVIAFCHIYLGRENSFSGSLANLLTVYISK